jgi:hypothetical protein
MSDRTVDYDKPISKYIFQSCWTCGKMIRTKNKTKLSLFMLDHWGKEGIKKCKPNLWGHIVNSYYQWNTRNI